MLSFSRKILKYIYNYLYISKLYITSTRFRGSEKPNCNNCNCNRLGHFYLFTFLPFPYQAFERPEQFVGHAGGIASDVETGNHIHGSEVRAVRAVVAPGDGDVLSPKDLRVALFLNLICFITF